MASNIPSDEIDKIIKDNSISPDEKTNRINMLIKQYNEPERGRPPYKGDRYSARSKSPFIRSESRDKPHQTQPGIYSPMNSNVQKYSGYVPPQSQYRPRFQQSPQFSSQMQPYMQPQYVQQPMQPQYVQQPMQSQYMQPQYMQQPMQPQYRPKSPYSQQENMSNQFSNLGIQDKYQSPRQSRSDTPSRQYQRSLSRRRSSSRPREAKVESIQKSKDILIKILNLFASNQKLYGIMTQYFSTRINKQPGESGSGGAEVNDIKLILSLLGVLFSGSFVSKYYEYRFNNSASGAALNASRRANNLNLIPGTNVLSYFPLASADAMFIICLFLYKILEDKNYDDKNPPNKTEIENHIKLTNLNITNLNLVLVLMMKIGLK